MEEKWIRTEALLGEQSLQLLHKACVAVIGIGGVGSWCAEVLCRTGVGKLILMDFDTVVPSNLNRQAEALSSTIGCAKTEALGKRLKDINPGLEMVLLESRYTREYESSLFDLKPDYLADCIDSVEDKCNLIAACVSRNIPVISSMGTGGKTDASRLKLTDLKKTNMDPLARAVRRELRKFGIEHLDVVFSDEEPRKMENEKPGTVMWVPATAGMLMAQSIIQNLILQENHPGQQ